MNIKQILAGGLSAVMAGATMGIGAFGASLGDYPAPFVTAATGANFLTVIGATAAAADVAGAINVAARTGSLDAILTGAAGTSGAGGVSGGTVVTSTGLRSINTAQTPITLNMTLGVTGLRTTLTVDDLPNLLASGSFDDADGTHKFKQYIDVTPAGTLANYRIDHDKPGSSSSVDPESNIGRMTTSPTDTEYLYRVRIVFDVALNGSKVIGKKLPGILGKEYTIDSTTSAAFAGAGTEKLVLLGSAQTISLKGGDTTKVTVGGKEYEITLNGVTTASKASVLVKGLGTEDLGVGATSTKFGDLKIYIDSATSLSSQTQSENTATLLIGADRLTLQENSTVKKGSTDASVQGAYSTLVTSGGLLTEFNLYFAGKSSTDDFIKLGGGLYLNQVFETFGLALLKATPVPKGSSDDLLNIKNSGDNSLTAEFKDQNGVTKQFTWAYKATSGGTQLSLADASGNAIHVVEGEVVARDEYIILDSGGFSQIFKVNSVTLDGSSSANIELRNEFTGAITKVNTGTDNQEATTIDGQTYYFINRSSSTFAVTWGSGSSAGSVGTYTTVAPALKTSKGALVALQEPLATMNVSTGNATFSIQLPGDIGATFTKIAGPQLQWNITARTGENGGATTATVASVVLNSTFANVTTTLGRTATGGYVLNVSAPSNPAERDLTLLVGISDTAVASTQPSLGIIQEPDADRNTMSAWISAAVGTSGSNSLAGAAAPGMTGPITSGAQTWGSNSNKASFVNSYGLLVERDSTTSAQPFVVAYYPDTQRQFTVVVAEKDADLSQAAATAATSAVSASSAVSTSTLAKLDTELSKADLEGKNLLVIGGPAVNKLAADLLDKTFPSYGEASGVPKDQTLIQLFENPTLDLFDNAKGKTALLVAGWEAANTRVGTSLLQQYDSTANKGKLTGTKVVLDAIGAVVVAVAAPVASPTTTAK